MALDRRTGEGAQQRSRFLGHGSPRPRSPVPGEPKAPAKPATPVTQAANAAVEAELPFGNQTDFELAQKNLIAKPDSVVIRDSTGRVVWDLDAYSFLTDGTPRPDTVNPSLWRQAQLLKISGLFQVTDEI